MVVIREYEESFRDEIIKIVLYCQNNGTRPDVTVDDQPELLSIRDKYISGGGNFWVAMDDDKLAGTIGIMNAGNGIGIMKKFFVYEKYRGNPEYLGRKLYAVLLDFAKQNNFVQLILDTPKNTDRAHIFYDKAGFKKVTVDELPVDYDYPFKDCDFFSLEIKN